MALKFLFLWLKNERLLLEGLLIISFPRVEQAFMAHPLWNGMLYDTCKPLASSFRQQTHSVFPNSRFTRLKNDKKSATATKIRLSFQSHRAFSVDAAFRHGNYGMTDYGQTIWVDAHVRGKYYKWGKFCTKTMKIIQINGLFSRLICIHNIIGLVYYDVFNKK